MSHLTEHQRYTISCMLTSGHTRREICIAIGKNKSVLSRELNRNKDERSGKYNYKSAQRKYDFRQKTKRKHLKFKGQLIDQTECLLRLDYSPEQVVGSLKKQGLSTVSVERIYQHIWQDKKQKGDLHTHLRRKGRRYRKRGNLKDSRGIIKNKVSIEKRPDIVEKRARFGDLEVDLILGENHKQAIVTINDRASGILKMGKVFSKQAREVGDKICELLEDWRPYLKTITSDNAKEFANHFQITQEFNIEFYFAHPYHSWERGSNENLNGLIRQYFPKGSDFSQITDKRIKEVQDILNNRPRKRYKYENPIFVMENLLFNKNVAFVS